jgi:hypothetical protein
MTLIEEQAVSGRWRSMTRAHAIPTDITEWAAAYIVRGLVDVLTVAGWAAQENKNAALIAKFQERLSIIVNLTLELRKGIGEDITSAYIAPQLFSYGEKFDAHVMDDTYADNRRSGEQVHGEAGEGGSSSVSSGEEVVAGTTEIGLARAVKGQWYQFEVMLKPKVVLCSALQ